jgi:hypothetical protein
MKYLTVLLFALLFAACGDTQDEPSLAECVVSCEQGLDQCKHTYDCEAACQADRQLERACPNQTAEDSCYVRCVDKLVPDDEISGDPNRCMMVDSICSERCAELYAGCEEDMSCPDVPFPGNVECQ